MTPRLRVLARLGLAFGRWRVTLGLPGGPVSLDVVRARYRALALAAHPDQGGETATMVALNRAMEEARRELSAGGEP